ncbi:hypothetical protein NHQ30_008532 [Ciborinia camelliae]|nr:hypothetical protein NHQ30_008532 [Ciborinia camelliae]
MSSASSAYPLDTNLEKSTPAAILKDKGPESKPQIFTDEPAIDPNIVTWTSSSNPENPQNWSTTRKPILTILLKYALALLSQRAKKLRFSTENWALRSKFDEEETTKEVMQAYPISFIDYRHWKPAGAALPFLALIDGMLIGLTIVLVDTPSYSPNKTEIMVARSFQKLDCL